MEVACISIPNRRAPKQAHIAKLWTVRRKVNEKQKKPPESDGFFTVPTQAHQRQRSGYTQLEQRMITSKIYSTKITPVEVKTPPTPGPQLDMYDSLLLVKVDLLLFHLQ
jgi:hypothetical protein